MEVAISPDPTRGLMRVCCCPEGPLSLNSLSPQEDEPLQPPLSSESEAAVGARPETGEQIFRTDYFLH